MRIRKLMISIAVGLMSTSAFPFSPGDCTITAQVGTSALQRYCARLGQKVIKSDPGHGLIGRLDKAAPIEGEPDSQHYYWIVTGDGHTYFDGNSIIGRKILKVCKIGELCAMKVGAKKSWEHSVDHATFWITKIVGQPVGE
jgi:hypothetical protein